MASLLYYWTRENYQQDQRWGFGYHLNQNNPRLRDVQDGGSIWAFTRNRSGQYVLASELVVRRVTRNVAGYRYGAYRAWAYADRSRYFDGEVTPDFAPIVRSLSIRAEAAVLGHSFQGPSAVRPMADDDHRVVMAFAKDLPILARVGYYPEDVLEAQLTGEKVVGRVVRDLSPRRIEYLYDPGKSSPRAVAEAGGVDLFGDPTDDRGRYLHTEMSRRGAAYRRHADTLRDRYRGRCQVCTYDPTGVYGQQICHVHHIVWVSRGGDDALSNLVLLCPNHHAIVHRDDAPFDYDGLQFSYSNGTSERLLLPDHFHDLVAS